MLAGQSLEGVLGEMWSKSHKWEDVVRWCDSDATEELGILMVFRIHES
jgi:hypothetical protein